MEETAIVIGWHIPPVEHLVETLQADGVKVFWLQPDKEFTSIPDPGKPTMVMLVVEDDADDEEVLAQLHGWKELFPLGYAMMLPLSSTQNWAPGIAQTRALLQASYRM